MLNIYSKESLTLVDYDVQKTDKSDEKQWLRWPDYKYNYPINDDDNITASDQTLFKCLINKSLR